MDNLLKNPEYKNTIMSIVIIQIISILILFSVLHASFKYLNTNLVDQNIALLGKLIAKYPDAEEEIVASFFNRATPEEIERGTELLSRYSYTQDTDMAIQPILSTLYPKVEFLIVLTSICLLIPLLLVIHRSFAIIYDNIRHISYVAERVVQDDFSHRLPESDDGDFATLNHNFNQMANRIQLSLQVLRDDKIFLKNTISDISHQLKTPLSSLIVFNELLLETEDMDTTTQTKFLKKSKSQLERIEWLTINLLKMARLESGSIQFDNDHIPLIYPIQIALNALNTKLSAKSLNINISGYVKDTMIYGDEDWLGEAFINIIKNSIEHTGHGGNIDIHLSHTPIFSQVAIIDTGEGIDEKDLPHIFKRFYKSNSSVKPESIGIGLALSKIIIEGQNGTIWVESKKGKGTKFIITFLKGIV